MVKKDCLSLALVSRRIQRTESKDSLKIVFLPKHLTPISSKCYTSIYTQFQILYKYIYTVSNTVQVYTHSFKYCTSIHTLHSFKFTEVFLKTHDVRQLIYSFISTDGKKCIKIPFLLQYCGLLGELLESSQGFLMRNCTVCTH